MWSGRGGKVPATRLVPRPPWDSRWQDLCEEVGAASRCAPEALEPAALPRRLRLSLDGEVEAAVGPAPVATPLAPANALGRHGWLDRLSNDLAGAGLSGLVTDSLGPQYVAREGCDGDVSYAIVFPGGSLAAGVVTLQVRYMGRAGGAYPGRTLDLATSPGTGGTAIVGSAVSTADGGDVFLRGWLSAQPPPPL